MGGIPVEPRPSSDRTKRFRAWRARDSTTDTATNIIIVFFFFRFVLLFFFAPTHTKRSLRFRSRIYRRSPHYKSRDTVTDIYIYICTVFDMSFCNVKNMTSVSKWKIVDFCFEFTRRSLSTCRGVLEDFFYFKRASSVSLYIIRTVLYRTCSKMSSVGILKLFY